MVGEHSVTHGDNTGPLTESSGLNGANGIGDAGNGSSKGASGKPFRTYKRRRHGVGSSTSNLPELEKHFTAPHTVLEDKMVKELVDIGLQKSTCEQVCDPKINCHSLLNGSDDCSYQHWRNVLENLFQSLSPKKGEIGGIQSCIEDALHNNPRITNTAKGSIDNHGGQCHMQRNSMLNGPSDPARGSSASLCNGSSSEIVHHGATMLCQRAFFRLIMSEKFASLCTLLSKNFHGMKADKLLDFSLIHSRMKEGAYERTPMLFSSDIQQFWRKLHSVGTEMVFLANNLSELSRAFCYELARTTELSTSGDREYELSVWNPVKRSQSEEPDTSVYEACTCRQCGQKSDGRDCLVCDSCEEMFHVSCIEPAVKEIPHRSWYCANCAANGIESPHEGCVVCERLNASAGTSGGGDAVPSYDGTLDEMEESSDGIIENGLQVFNGSKKLLCKVCRCMLQHGEEFLVCEHRFCQYKYYHTRCLTNKQLKSYCQRWLCPSCLCRVCLADKDDDHIILCDSCDHGYHIYCLSPPLDSAPKGKWFCKKCDTGIQAIQSAKRAYHILEKKQKKREGKKIRDNNRQKQEFDEAVDTSGGMAMLLTAATKLNYEEELAARHSRS